jgi:hypothetical protein
MEELILSNSMKKLVANYKILSPFHSLTEKDVVEFSERILSGSNISKHKIDEFVKKVAEFRLCHGRARFIASIVDHFLKHKDIDGALHEFIINITNVNASIFPLRFLREDSQKLLRVVGEDSLHSICVDGIWGYIMRGSAILNLRGQRAADAVQFGLGFCTIDTDKIIVSVNIQELAVIYCLRRFISLSDIVHRLTKDMF